MDPNTDVTSWTMIRGAARGGARERERFGRRYADPLRAFFSARWRQPAASSEVEDALQEVFLECFRAGGALEKADSRRVGGFRAFLHGIARNVAHRVEARRARRARGVDSLGIEVDLLEGDEDPVSVAFDKAWAQSVMREAARIHEARAREDGEAALRRLQLLRLRFGEGLPVREIADRIGDPDKDAIHRDIRRARHEFAMALREVVAFDYPAATDAVIDQECQRLQDLLE